MKKWTAMLLVLLLTALASAGQAFTMTGLELESVSRDWATSLFFTRMEALTGIHVDAQAIADKKEYQKALEEMKAGNVPAETLFKANLSREDEIRLIDNGAIIDLAGLIDENMPNLSALLASHPQWREAISLADGRIASLPLLSEHERQVCVWINADWLGTLGLEMPKSIDELTAALTAFVTRDPNKNNSRDEKALDVIGVWELRWLLPYFGIVADDYNLARGADGELVFAPELPAYRDFVEQLTAWYRAGILPDDAFTAVHSATSLSEKDEKAAVTSGVIISAAPYTVVSATAATQYKALLMPGPDGETVWRDLLGEVWTGGFAVTSACADPAEALRWIDALYGETGVKLAYAGAEGEDYEYSEEGYWHFVNDSARDVSAIRAESLMYTGSTMPGLFPYEFLTQVDSETDRHVMAENELVSMVSRRVIDDYQGAANIARANELNVTLAGMVDVGIAQFVTGERALDDKSWADWLDGLRASGSEEMVELFQ